MCSWTKASSVSTSANLMGQRLLLLYERVGCSVIKRAVWFQ